MLFGHYVCIRICMFMDGFHIRYEILHGQIRHTQGKHILKYIFLYDATHDMPVCKINVFWNMSLKVQKQTEYFKIIFVFVALCSYLASYTLRPSNQASNSVRRCISITPFQTDSQQSFICSQELSNKLSGSDSKHTCICPSLTPRPSV